VVCGGVVCGVVCDWKQNRAKSVVWCGVVRCDAVWWCGVVWCGVVLCGGEVWGLTGKQNRRESKMK
jgi:hypothetical protein